MSFISPVAEKLAVVHLPMMPVPFVRELQARGWEFIEIPGGGIPHARLQRTGPGSAQGAGL
jgi:N-dimethylarginine dimethylaminohydrolase